jgi:hypothetical protein
MKKKIVEIFVCMMLVLTSVSMTVNSENNIIDDDKAIVTNTEDDCGCGVTNEDKVRYRLMKERPIPLDVDVSNWKPTVIDTPDYFNWMDYEGKDWTTQAKDQNPCGGCWLFAAVGALESILNVREGKADLDVDLSEQYVLSCLPRAGNCIGGEPYPAFYYIMSNKSSGNNCNGIIPESCFPYKGIDAEGCDAYGCNHDPVLCDEKCENWEDYLIPISDWGIWYPDGSSENRDAIKTQIMQQGPVTSALMVTYFAHGVDNLVDWLLKNHESNDFYTSSLQFDTINHHVVIVGWKDIPEISNGGYWIIKNSWGLEYGYDGFFNIGYGSLRIDSSQIVWVDYSPDAIVNWKPTANAGGIYYGDVGEEIIFDANGSFDHEGEIISFEWDYGDGQYGSGMTTNHIYESLGVYSVMLTVIDNEGNAVNDTTWAFIGRSNDPPNAPIIDGPSEGKKGVEYDLNISAIDPDGDDLYYYIHWGDMNVDRWIGPFKSGEIVTLNHTWNSKTTFSISAEAKDEYEFKSEWTTFEVIMPKNKPIDFNMNIIKWLFERFPNAFPIIKSLLKLTLEEKNISLFFWR